MFFKTTYGARSAAPARAGRPAASGSRGYTLLEILVTVFIIAIVAAIAIPIYTKFIQKARETAVIAYLSKIKKAQVIHQLEDPVGNYSGDFDALEATGALPPSTGSASRIEHDYRIDLAAGADAFGPFWNATAEPLSGSTSVRWFYTDKTGVIRAEVGATAGPASPPI